MGYSERLTGIIDEVIAPAAAQVDRERRFPRAGLEALGEAGILGLTVPAARGGGGRGLAEAADAVAQVARACGSTALVLATHYAATAVLAAHGPRSVLTGIAAGRHLTTLAWSEADSCGHFLAPAGTAGADGDRVRLDARKSWVTSAGQAGSYVWSSRPVAEEGAMTLWLVAAGSPGLTVSPAARGMGLRGIAAGPVSATSVRVPAVARLGADGAGLDVALATALPWFLVLCAAASAGLMEAVIAAASGHLAQTRRKPADYPAGRAGLARMRIIADSVRARLDDALMAPARGRPDDRLRLFELRTAATEASIAVTGLAMTVCGGPAFRTDLGIERRFRDALTARLMAPATQAPPGFIGRAVSGLPLLEASG